MKTASILLAGLLAGAGLPSAVLAADAIQPHVTVPRATAPLQLDGDLSDPAWQEAGVIEDLIQNTPFTGQPTPFHTRVLLLRDDNHLYIGVHAVDPEPDLVQTHGLRRDGNQDVDDHITLMLNTFDDHRNAYIFRINAGGARDDAVEANGVDTADFGWDGIWEAKARRVPDGWDLEIAISTRSLQFRPDSGHWGFNVARWVPRKSLVTKWAAISPAYGAFSPQQYGILDGMQGFKAGSGFEFSPYLLVRSDQIDTGAKRAQVGGEVKYNFTPQLSGTLTVNTDFAQTEADAQQINLSRFSLYFPEKRQFFLDGSSLFAFNNGGTYGNLNGGFVAFYSRDIGLADGHTVPIDEGVKLTGRVGDLSMGVLDVDTGAFDGVADQNLFVGRFTYNLSDEWQVGTLLTRGDPSGATDAAFTGVDAAFKTDRLFGHKFEATAWGANTGGAKLPGLTRGWGYELTYPNYVWYGDLKVNTYGDAFDTSLGFLPRPGTKQLWEELGWFPTPPPPTPVNYWQLDEFYNQVDDLAGHLQSYELHLSPGVSLTDGSAFYPTLMREYENLSAPFAVDNNVTIPAGTYRFQRWRMECDSPVDTFRLVLRPTWGQFYSGRVKDGYAQLTYAGLDGRLELGLTNESVFGDLPQGHFVQRLWQLNAAWSFDPDLSISSFVQYDTSQDQLGFNTRLHWAIAADKDLYVVWNRNWRESVLAQPGVPDVADAVIVKLSWNFSR
ncbi:MAG TPA: DUF5916 domain-containing protein [Gammaproteobacteria bacterium]